MLICRLYLGLMRTITDDYGAEFAVHSERVGNAYRVTDKVNIPDLQKKLQRRIDLVTENAQRTIRIAALVLLHQKFFRRGCLVIGAEQHGHRGSVLTSAAISRRRIVAIEFGMWRSGRSGGTAGSITFG
jgi:hypothetical protein